MTEQEVLEDLERAMLRIKSEFHSLPETFDDFRKTCLVYSKLVEQWIRLKRGKGK